jgi:hypothetical protein
LLQGEARDEDLTRPRLQIEAERSEPVTDERDEQHQNLYCGHPISEHRPVVLHVVQLLQDLLVLRHRPPHRPPKQRVLLEFTVVTSTSTLPEHSSDPAHSVLSPVRIVQHVVQQRRDDSRTPDRGSVLALVTQHDVGVPPPAPRTGTRRQPLPVGGLEGGGVLGASVHGVTYKTQHVNNHNRWQPKQT